MFCYKCGAELEEGTVFCPNCGSCLTDETADRNMDTAGGGFSAGDFSGGPGAVPGQNWNAGSEENWYSESEELEEGTRSFLDWEDDSLKVPDDSPRREGSSRTKWIVSISLSAIFVIITGVVVWALMHGGAQGADATGIVVKTEKNAATGTGETGSTEVAKNEDGSDGSTAAAGGTSAQASGSSQAGGTSAQASGSSQAGGTSAQTSGSSQTAGGTSAQASGNSQTGGTSAQASGSSQAGGTSAQASGSTQSAGTSAQASGSTQSAGTSQSSDSTRQAVRADQSSGSTGQAAGSTQASTAAGSTQAGTAAASSTDSEYVFPDSNSTYLTKAQLENLTKDQLLYARNEIYARYGRKFVDQTIQAYFNSKSWYVARYEPADFDAISEATFNEYEKANIKLILEVEASKGYFY